MSNNTAARPIPSRRSTSGSRQVIPPNENLIIPDGPVGEETAELLAEILHPHSHEAQEMTVESESHVGDPEENEERARRQGLPWWKRPSPYWLLVAIPISSVAFTATIAPKVEIYRMLACSTLKPDIFRDDYPEIAPRGSSVAQSVFSFSDNVRPQKCATDPLVTAAVATLIAVITVCAGVLSVITTAWWGAFSDRHGRVKVMGISVLGLLVTDATFILVTHFYQHLPGGYWMLVVGPTVEGLLGGFTTGVAAIHAYIADTTTEHNRSRILSLNLGLMFSGMAFGPTLGSLIIRTFKHPISVFYMATAVHSLYTLMVWFILPESVTRTQMRKARTKYRAELENSVPTSEHGTALRVLHILRLLFSFLSPLTIFWPSDKDLNNPLKRQPRDWNLTLMAIAYGFALSVMGSYQYKFQYASLQFGWSTEIIGYWLSLMAAIRAFFLTAILPIAIKLFKPKPIVLELPATPRASETTPLLSGRETNEHGTPKTIKKEIHSPGFDLGLARFSMIVELISYTFMALARSSLPFTSFSLVGSFGSGFSPAMQSVALALYTRRGGTEIGRLFGALGVIQALSGQILGPAMYGFVFVKTVTIFPSAILFITVLTVVFALLALVLVRLPPQHTTRDAEEPTTPSTTISTPLQA